MGKRKKRLVAVSPAERAEFSLVCQKVLEGTQPH